MTERLSSLLHDAADGVDVPTPTGAAVIAHGRRLRRRRRTAQVVSAAAVLAIVSVGALTLGGDDPRSRGVDPAGDDAISTGATFSIGPTVYTDDGTRSTTLEDASVTALDYTSAGVLVRHGTGAAPTGNGPQTFSLLRADGSVSDLDVQTNPTLPDGETSETGYATDPSQPYLAYTQVDGDEVHLLVLDVERDRQVADVTLPGAQVGLLQQVALDGGAAYVGEGQQTRVVDWRAGTVAVSRALTGVLQSVADDHALLIRRDGSPEIVDVTTGAVLVPSPAPARRITYSNLTPDGAHAVFATDRTQTSFEVYDVASGRHVEVSGDPHLLGWTSDGRSFGVSRDGVLTLCTPDTGACRNTALDLAKSPGNTAARLLQLGGRLH